MPSVRGPVTDELHIMGLSCDLMVVAPSDIGFARAVPAMNPIDQTDCRPAAGRPGDILGAQTN